MPRSFRHLDLSERVFIETQLSLGMRPAGIAAGLRRARSTISREIRRNGWRAKLRKGAIAGGYRCVAADVLAGKAPAQTGAGQPALDDHAGASWPGLESCADREHPGSYG
jgi:Helix-turn-helix domain